MYEPEITTYLQLISKKYILHAMSQMVTAHDLVDCAG
jgi:hypothetical protein